MIKFLITLNSYLVGLVNIWYNNVSRIIVGKSIGEDILAILSKKSIGEIIGNTFYKSISEIIGNAF